MWDRMPCWVFVLWVDSLGSWLVGLEIEKPHIFCPNQDTLEGKKATINFTGTAGIS